MLSESGTLEDYGNPKLITAGLVQREIPDVLDTDPFQQHQAAWGCLCVSGDRGAASVFAQRGRNKDPFPLRLWLQVSFTKGGGGKRKRRYEIEKKRRWKASHLLAGLAVGAPAALSPLRNAARANQAHEFQVSGGALMYPLWGREVALASLVLH